MIEAKVTLKNGSTIWGTSTYNKDKALDIFCECFENRKTIVFDRDEPVIIPIQQIVSIEIKEIEE